MYRRVYLIPSFNVHYAVAPRGVSSRMQRSECILRAATNQETQNASDVRGYHHQQGVSVGIGHCEDCKTKFRACIDQRNPERACRRSFYDCAGDDANACPPPQ